MKRYILMIMCCVATLMAYAQYSDCIAVNEFAPTISRWGEEYQPSPHELECWTIDLGVQGHAKITYNINLEAVQAIDQVLIYEIDANGNAICLRTFSTCSTSGSIITNSTTGKVKIEYWGYCGNCGGMYDGFQIRVEQATCCDLVSHDHYILGKLGIGTTQPQEMLHVNGAIRGGGEYGALQLRTTTGFLEFGSMDAGIVRFKTNGTGYYFDKGITIANGNLMSTTRLTFMTANSNSCMTILTNGNVGVGTTNPNYKLDVAGTICAQELIVETTGADFVFADDYQLRPLSEVKAFIAENKHLPEIKSAQEMQENGVGINELQTKLLQKIEELTLYILQQEEKIQQQELRIKALETK